MHKLPKLTIEDFTRFREEILFLHKKNIEAHLNRDPNYLVQYARAYFPTIEDLRENYSDYLENYEFSKYEDDIEPIVGFSNDGSIGWSIVKVSVKGKGKNKHDLEFTCAWITLYKRCNDKW